MFVSPRSSARYTGGAKSVEGSGETLADLLADLDSRHPGCVAGW